MSLLETDLECQVFDTGGGPLTCDDTSLVVSDLPQKNSYCKNVRKGKI